MNEQYTLHVNGANRAVSDAWLGENLLYVLRERLGLMAAKGACEQGECGSCSVLVDDRLVCSCLVLAASAVGRRIVTVEGLAEAGAPSDVQQAFVDTGAVQCGFCTPGLIIAAHALLDRIPEPSDREVREELSGNVCRCTGYGRIIEAVQRVAAGRGGWGSPAWRHAQAVHLLFSDLRSFTTASELLEPEVVIEIVNRYLSIMTEAIMDHGGTLITYMGDGIMALFGAPIEQADHADRAVAAAREMVTTRLDEFNAWMQERGYGEGFRMGVGMNSGPVMVGNVGSERRMDYTAIGDTVNTASRIEGMTKGTPHMIFVSDSTRSMLQRPLEDLFYVDEMQVRGRKRPVQLWSVPEGSSS